MTRVVTHVTARALAQAAMAFVGATLLALPLARGVAADVKPDPNALPPHEVHDLAYGDVLFYFYQDDYFDAITRLLAAQDLQRLPNTQGEAELLLGALYLSLGEHVEAGKIFERLLNASTTEAVRNKAWFYLAKVWYQRGYFEESERALRRVSDRLQPRINAERYMLLAQIMLRDQRYDEAIATLRGWKGQTDWTAYAQFNLGVALVRAGRLQDAAEPLGRVGLMDAPTEELRALKDKANLALGFAFLQADRPVDALPVLERIRLDGPSSTKALLGAGWAYSARGNFKRALVPWLALRKRSALDSAVQEAYLTVPYAYKQLGASGQAAEFYTSAIESFEGERRRIDEAIGRIRDGGLLDRLLEDDKNGALTWYWQLKTLPDAPESRYLYQLLAGNEFQEGLKNYRELKFMRHNLDQWKDNLSAFAGMLDTRRKAYGARVPKADAVMAATDLSALGSKREQLEARLNQIAQSDDVAALGSPEQQRDWATLKRIEAFLAKHSDDPAYADMRDRVRLVKGVLYWRLAENFQSRLRTERRTVEELKGSLAETAKRAAAVDQAKSSAPGGTNAFEAQVGAVGGRMDTLQQRLALASSHESRYLQNLAIEELKAQQERLDIYQVQARYELAAIYDKTIQPVPKVHP
ncbi:MAG: hypothetical protein NVSMB10_16350 [Steroidobacteraceae bacterium]